MKKLLLYFLQNLHFIFYADTHRPTTQVSSSILSHSIYRDKIQSTFSLLPYPNDPYSFFFLLLCLPSSFCPLLSLSLSLHQPVNAISLCDPSRSIRLSACPSIWISNLRIFPMLFDDSVSLCHCRNWDLEVGQPNHRRSVFPEARKKKRKTEEEKRKRKKVNRKRGREREENRIRPSNARLERQSYFTNARTSFTLPLMD